jgi:hypothetical protein
MMEDLVDLDMTPRGTGYIEAFDRFFERKNMTLQLTNDEIKFIMDVLGELPSKTGAFLVMNNIAKQQQEAAQFEQVKQTALEGAQNV